MSDTALGPPSSSLSLPDGDEPLFAKIAQDLKHKGYSLNLNAVAAPLCAELLAQLQQLEPESFHRAGIGRAREHTQNIFVRRDKIRWINGSTLAEQAWQNWLTGMQSYLNRKLFLGLFSFESHFAHYQPGDFYKKHYDAFKGQANRRLSIVLYLNPGWRPDDGGELVIYSDEGDQRLLSVTPAYGTLVVFLSEDFAHEVLPAKRHRYSIAGWFRVNASTTDAVDPPR